MKKTFVIQVEYPDCDFVSSEEVMEVTQECIEHYMELHFGANIMDGDYDRIKVKEVTDGFSLVRRMREAQDAFNISVSEDNIEDIDFWHIRMLELEREVDEYLKIL